jgi:hypothetical protein
VVSVNARCLSATHAWQSRAKTAHRSLIMPTIPFRVRRQAAWGALLATLLLTGCEDLFTPLEPTPSPSPPPAAPTLAIRWNCALLPAVPGSSNPQLVFSPPPLSTRQQQFTAWFNRAAIMQNPMLANVFVPFYTLAGVENALASPQGIFLNPQWFALIGDIAATGIFAHEVAHIAQFYGLVNAAPPVGTQFEGQADYVAGFMLRASGVFAPAEAQAYATWIRIAGGAGSNTHPPGFEREQLFLLGWRNAGGGA